MNIKLKIEVESERFTPSEMKCGQVGIIRSWSANEYIGTVVQKHGSCLIALGKEEGFSWCDVNILDGRTFLIELLKSGDTITIE